MTSNADPKKAFEPTDATRRWQERVDAAKQEVAAAEEKMVKVDSAREQTFAYWDLKMKERALRIALVSQ